jgi:hypothetical protein
MTRFALQAGETPIPETPGEPTPGAAGAASAAGANTAAQAATPVNTVATRKDLFIAFRPFAANPHGPGSCQAADEAPGRAPRGSVLRDHADSRAGHHRGIGGASEGYPGGTYGARPSLEVTGLGLAAAAPPTICCWPDGPASLQVLGEDPGRVVHLEPRDTGVPAQIGVQRLLPGAESPIRPRKCWRSSPRPTPRMA